MKDVNGTEMEDVRITPELLYGCQVANYAMGHAQIRCKNGIAFQIYQKNEEGKRKGYAYRGNKGIAILTDEEIDTIQKFIFPEYII